MMNITGGGMDTTGMIMTINTDGTYATGGTTNITGDGMVNTGGVAITGGTAAGGVKNTLINFQIVIDFNHKQEK